MCDKYLLLFAFQQFSEIERWPVCAGDGIDQENNIEVGDTDNAYDIPSDKRNSISMGEMDKAEVIFNILINNPADFELKEKPYGIRKNFLCTLDSRIICVNDLKADGNGAYVHHGRPKRFYFVELEASNHIKTCTVAHKENDSFYVNKRATDNEGKTALSDIGKRSRYNKQFVPKENVYELIRTYKKSKLNPFIQMVATIQREDAAFPNPFYLLTYRWTDGADHKEDDFIVGRHGNASKPYVSPYYRQDQNMMGKAKSLIQTGISSSQAYRQLVNEAEVNSCCLLPD